MYPTNKNSIFFTFIGESQRNARNTIYKAIENELKGISDINTKDIDNTQTYENNKKQSKPSPVNKR